MRSLNKTNSFLLHMNKSSFFSESKASSKTRNKWYLSLGIFILSFSLSSSDRKESYSSWLARKLKFNLLEIPKERISWPSRIHYHSLEKHLLKCDLFLSKVKTLHMVWFNCIVKRCAEDDLFQLFWTWNCSCVFHPSHCIWNHIPTWFCLHR